MGLILDSSVLIAAERKGGNPPSRYSSEIAGLATGGSVAFSVVTLIELAHGAARADHGGEKDHAATIPARADDGLPVHPVTVPVALRAGQIDGKSTAKGVRIALSDLLIGVTALELGYRVATANVRRFQGSVPRLKMVPLLSTSNVLLRNPGIRPSFVLFCMIRLTKNVRHLGRMVTARSSGLDAEQEACPTKKEIRVQTENGP